MHRHAFQVRPRANPFQNLRKADKVAVAADAGNTQGQPSRTGCASISFMAPAPIGRSCRATFSIFEADAVGVAIDPCAAKRKGLHATQSRQQQKAYCRQGSFILSGHFGLAHRLPELGDFLDVEKTALLYDLEAFSPRAPDFP